MLVEAADKPLPASHDLLGLARVWRQVFYPQGRSRDFIDAWQHCIGKAPIAA